jgi:hypothetical protein
VGKRERVERAEGRERTENREQRGIERRTNKDRGDGVERESEKSGE